jgi:hypothetical protein
MLLGVWTAHQVMTYMLHRHNAAAPKELLDIMCAAQLQRHWAPPDKLPHLRWYSATARK